MIERFYTVKSAPPWHAGWLAVRVNLMPALVLQVMAVGVVTAYYTSPAVNAWLETLARLKSNGGYLFSAVLGMFFCGLLPWLFRMCMPALRPQSMWRDLAFGLGWWGCMSMQTDAFYRMQALVWGAASAPSIVMAKVAMDMLVYTPLIAAPMNSVSHLWKATGFDSRATRALIKEGGYRQVVLPNLIMNWAIWTPGTAIVYSLPSLLQFPMASLGSCFWSLLCIVIAAESKRN